VKLDPEEGEARATRGRQGLNVVVQCQGGGRREAARQHLLADSTPRWPAVTRRGSLQLQKEKPRVRGGKI
jgi:hypothetical protein